MTDITSEALVCTLQNLAIREPETLADQEMLLEQLSRILDLSHTPSYQQNQAQITEDTPIDFIVRKVRQNIILNRDSVSNRLSQLLKYVKGETPKIPSLDAAVVLRIVTEVARMPHFIADVSPLSHMIMQTHCLVLAKLQARDGGEDVDIPHLEEEEVEKCDICFENIPFESLRWAKCVNGHQFCKSQALVYGYHC